MKTFAICFVVLILVCFALTLNHNKTPAEICASEVNVKACEFDLTVKQFEEQQAKHENDLYKQLGS